jgi:hypothetical protein
VESENFHLRNSTRQYMHPTIHELADSKELCPSRKDYMKKLQPYMVGGRYVYVTSKMTYASMKQPHPATLGLNCYRVMRRRTRSRGTT